MKKILIMDTTLRDGEKIPGAKLNINEQLKIAYQLQKMKVDIIETSFPSLSHNDLEITKAIAQKVGTKTTISVPSRAIRRDIDEVYNCIKNSYDPIIHIVLGSSDLYDGKNKEQIFMQNIDAIKYAKSILPKVQYSFTDASRQDFESLWGKIKLVVEAGANIINIPDTVSVMVPDEYGEMINKINYRLKNLDKDIILSVHCHNDLGLATANSLIAIKNGADKIECTINGIGERAGNTALEEVAMAIKLHKKYYNAYTNIATNEISNTSKLVSYLMGIDIQVNKPITGSNAFAHYSNLRMTEITNSENTYEIIHPEDIGIENSELVLTSRSGESAFKKGLAKIGFDKFSNKEFKNLFKNFLELANKKKEIYSYDLLYLIEKNLEENSEQGNEFLKFKNKLYELIDIEVVSNILFSRATVKIRKKDSVYKGEGVGNGPVDAVYTAIRDVIKINIELREYKIKSVSKGKEALGKVAIQVNYNGKEYTAKAVDTDVVRASAYAFVNAINSVIIGKETSETV
ncbi:MULTISPECIES: 2-isopropylmalate synthase [Clostridium]|uniref:2-isopropylmalate synthase n=1 Tax=Clostridium TaxID=1485 RepID=UPI000A81E94E|nr:MULTISPECIES: 2-isopropylmalate synthase [Clostridium]MCD2345933.1 2-isopropylmalate synthase [Clostridium guangxiense]